MAEGAATTLPTGSGYHPEHERYRPVLSHALSQISHNMFLSYLGYSDILWTTGGNWFVLKH